MRRWNFLFCAVLLTATISCVGCNSRPTPPEEDPSNATLGTEICVYEDEEDFSDIKTPRRKASGSSALEVAEPADSDSPQDTPAATSKDSPEAKAVKIVATNFAKSVETGDKALFMKNVVVTRKTRKNMTTLFEGLSAMQRYNQAMLKTYGEKLTALRREVPTPEKIQTAKVTINGSTAKLEIPNNPDLNLVKQRGKWKVDMLGEVPKAELPMALAMMKRMKSAAEKGMKKIGKRGYTAKRIEKEMQQDIMGGMMPPGMTPPPMPDMDIDMDVTIEVTPVDPDDESDETPATDEDAIKAVMDTITTTIADDDKNTFMENVVATPKTKSDVETMFDAIVVMQQFTEAMTEAYGEKSIMRVPGGTSMPSLKQEDIDNAKVNVRKDTATVKIKKQKPLQMVKQDGVWKWNVLKMIKVRNARQRKSMIMMMKRGADAVKKVLPKIGTEGYTAKKINNELMRSMMPPGMMPPGGPMPPRPR